MSELFPTPEERARPTKAVIAAAGFGTRFLPYTKAVPKEMLPIVDRPVIQIVVEELVLAGIKDIIIVGSSNKRTIEDHFDAPREDLLAELRAGGPKKQPFIDEVNRISELANFSYLRQKGPKGNATPLLNAAHLINNEPFIYTFADDFIDAVPSRTEQLIATFLQRGGSVYTGKKVKDPREFDMYGIVDGEAVDEDTMRVNTIVEKPGIDHAPSNLASVSSYLLDPAIMGYLESAAKAHDPARGEFTIQPSMQAMMDDGHLFHAREITNGTYYDTGDKLGYLKTVIAFALREDFAEDLRGYMRDQLEQS